MNRKLLFTPEAQDNLKALAASPAKAAIHKQVLKALGFLEINPRHPSLNTHEYESLGGGIYEAYAQNNTPGAYRIFFQYGPDEIHGKKRIPVLTILAITPHP